MPGANANGNGRESPDVRGKATANDRNKELAWEALEEVEGTELIPLQYRKQFRRAFSYLAAQLLCGSRICMH